MFKYKWLVIYISSLLIPTYISATNLRVTANSGSLIEFIKVNSVDNRRNGEWDRVLYGVNGLSPSSAKEGDILKKLDQYLWFPPSDSSANVSYKSVENNREYEGVAFLISAPLGKKQATYRYPCETEGGTNIFVWAEVAPEDERKDFCTQGVKVAIAENITNNSQIFSAPITQKNLFSPQKLISQAPEYSNAFIYYCNVAAKDKGWWTSRGSISKGDPCREAYKECLISGLTERDCKVISAGNWRARDKDLLVNFSCKNNKSYQRRGNGTEITNNLLILKAGSEARSENAGVCILNVFKPNSLIVAPATKQATMVQTRADDRSIVIEALAGEVVVRSIQRPEGFILKVGERYSYPSDIFEPINVEQVVANSPAVQNFFDPNNWFPGAEEQLAQYRDNLGRGRVKNDTEDTSTNDNGGDSNFLGKIAPVLLPLIMRGLLSNNNSQNNNDSPDGTRRGN